MDLQQHRETKRALITGGSRGIGYALADELASRHYDLVLVAIDNNRLKKARKMLKETYSVNIATLSLDLSESEGPQKLLDQLQQRDLELDVLINNAGFGAAGTFYEGSLRRYKKMIQVNITALMELTHLLLNNMLKRKDAAHIMNVASTAAFQPGPGMSVYYASKSFVYSFTEALEAELQDTSISVSTLCPGPTSTDFHETAGTSGRIINNSLLSMKPEKVARVGIAKMFNGKSLIVPGLLNKVGVVSAKFLPRKLLKKIVAFIHSSSE